MENLIKFLYSFFAVAVAAAISAYFVGFGMDIFYHNLDLPPFTPPDSLFPIAWSFLYTLMVTSFYLVLRQGDDEAVQKASMLFLGQLFLQMIWTFLFFYNAYFLFALIVLVLLLWTVFVMIKRFKRLNKMAGNLQYPYFLWLLFATYMNAGIVYLNGNALNF